jgi:hypothetical protein
MNALKLHNQAHDANVRVKPSPFFTYLLWALATTIGWWAGVLDLDFDAKTYLEIVRLLPIYLADGLLIGLVLGIGQALVLRRLTNFNWQWVWVTFIGYGLAFMTGLLVTTLIPSIIIRLRYGIFFLPLVEPSTVSIFLNMDDLFWGGFLIGIFQWPILKNIIPNPGWNKAVLWVLANWFVLGASIFVRAFTHETLLANFQMPVMGVVMGLLTGGILLRFLSNSDLVDNQR